MGLTKEFEDDPIGFLKTYVVIVPGEGTGTARSKKKFYLKKRLEDRGNVVELLPKLVATGEFIEAYWLPWNLNEAISTDLDDKANFLFTAEMTNCRFSVLTTDPGKPKIADVAGNGSAGQRDVLENKKGFPKRDTEEGKKVRRLSISEKNEHGYKGQRAKFEDSSSAFVFGHRKAEVWNFYAQIVTGIMSGDYLKSGLPDVLSPVGLYDFSTGVVTK